MSGSSDAAGSEVTRRPALGIALKLAAALFFSLMYVAIRLAPDAPIGEVVFFRGLFALIPVLALSYATNGPSALVRTERPWLHLRRAIAGAASMFLNFYAVTRIPLADLTAFTFVMPIFATVLAAILLGERVGPHRAVAVVAGFVGVLLMTEAHGGPLSSLAGGTSLGATAAIGAALLSAFVVVFIRHMSATETSEAIVFYFMSACAAAGAAAMAFERPTFVASELGWLIACGILGGAGQVCMTYSYRFAEPSLLAAFDYTAMVWAVTLGYFLFNERPAAQVLAGAGVVIASGLYIGWRERRLHRKRLASVLIAS
jgi:drug/metabolite transporter (DMT)-like permease